MFRDLRMLAALGAVALWSTNAYAADLALDHLSVGWLLLVQYATATTVFAGIRLARLARLARRAPPAARLRRRCPRELAVGLVGLTGTIFLQYTAFALAPIVAANVLAYAWPLLAALALLAARRDARSVVAAGLSVLGFAGVALIFTAPAHETTASAAPAPTWGYLAALGSAACMTIYTLGAGRVSVPVADLLLPATTVGALAAAAIVSTDGGPVPSAVGIAAAAYIGLGPMAAGYGLWTVAMAHGGAARLSPLGYATPLLSTLVLLATGAPATATTLIGISLVLACSTGVLAHQHRHGASR